MLTTPHAFRRHLLGAAIGLAALIVPSSYAAAQCQSQTQTLLAADGAGADRFGNSVALSGNTAVIGATFDDDLGDQSGSAYVFESVAGVWTQMAKLNATDGAAGDGFGFSVAVSGDTVLIGAFADDDLGNQSGSAYVFERVAGVWTQMAKLNAADGAAGDDFGISVAVGGDTALIGAALDDDLGSSSGSAYVFERIAGVWIQTAKLTADDGAAGNAFASSVAISGSTVLIGAPFGNGPPTNSGSAYVFENVGGAWTKTAKLTASDGTFADRFGASVAVNGDTAVVGALFDDDLGDSSGSAYVFEKVAGVWTQTRKLTAPDGAANDNFGVSVAVGADTVLIGARLDDDLGSDSGSAYVFARIAGVWTQTAKLHAAEGAAGDGFGGSVAVSPVTAVVGSPWDDDLGSDSGSAHAFPLVVDAGEDCNANTIPDACDIANGTSTDCNQNGIPDDCEPDGDGDGVIDDCDNCALPNPLQTDCNNDGIGNVCDLAGGTSLDCNGNTIPDGCDIANGTSTDCNQNGIPDECETDGDGDGVIDDCDNCALPNPSQADCNDNGIGDVCDLADGTSLDCNANSIPDECEPDSDSDGDGVLDVCDNCALPNPAQADCNNNGLGDVCDIADCTGSPLCSDCNGNAVPDECDVDPADPDGNSLVSPDCNANGIPDECDLASSIDFVHQSGEFSPFRFLVDATEVIPAPPVATGDVTLTVEVKADLDQSFEFVDVLLNGTPVGRLFESGGVQCSATFDTGSLVIPADTFNAMLPGDVTAKLTPSPNVDACTGVVKLRLSYSAGSADGNDCNANGIPDECDADTDGDGVIDDCDPCPLDNPDDTDGDGVCDTDDLCSDTSLGLLVGLDGCTRPEGPCCFAGAVCIDGNDRQTCEAFPGGVFQGEGLTCGDPDGDGVAGCSDGCPLDPAKTHPGVCGCGVPDDDEDFDGIADCEDRCLQTPFDTPVNVCGCEETGACCAAAGGCFDGIERSLCRVIAGFYQGDGSTCAEGCGFGDLDGDGDVDLADFGGFARCFTGPAAESIAACVGFDVDGCGNIDGSDFQTLRRAITGP